jgi:leader peptidase (prepilin peptidase)/N-methyltransferase
VNDLIATLNTTPIGPVFSFCFGLIWGSFFNVCIYRLPLDQSLWRRGSHCTKCDRPIPWRWNIPVLAYVWLRGRCGFCREPISLQYPIIELVSGLLFLILFLRFGASPRFLAYTVFSSSLLVLSVIDLHHRIIPDEISLSGIVLGFLCSFFLGDISWKESLLGIVFGGGIFFSIAYLYERFTGREGLGGGDVKLLAMLGAWLGVESILIIVILSSAVGSLFGILLMIFRRRNLQTAIPFGPFLAAAGFFYLFAGARLQALLFPDFS